MEQWLQLVEMQLKLCEGDRQLLWSQCHLFVLLLENLTFGFSGMCVIHVCSFCWWSFGVFKHVSA